MQIIPIAGNSSRFFNQGYDVVKYLLPLGKRTLIGRILNELDKKRSTLVILNSKFSSLSTIENCMEDLGFEDYEVVEIDQTNGQLMSVVEGVAKSRFKEYSEECWIFNGDTVRFGELPFELFRKKPEVDAFIEVFRQPGSHWSFVDKLGNVGVVSEKERISELCSTGLYGFRSLKTMTKFYNSSSFKLMKGESYVSSVFHQYMSENRTVWAFETPSENFLLCGTPSEYEEAKKHDHLFN